MELSMRRPWWRRDLSPMARPALPPDAFRDAAPHVSEQQMPPASAPDRKYFMSNGPWPITLSDSAMVDACAGVGRFERRGFRPFRATRARATAARHRGAAALSLARLLACLRAAFRDVDGITGRRDSLCLF